jgi:putative PIN family toxin of toxin-antitoxin system
LVIDTNILVSALLSDTSLPAHQITLWRGGRFELLTSAIQIDELKRVTRYPEIKARVAPTLAGQLINELREIALTLDALPTITVCADPYDNYLLAITTVGAADFLVTGDKQDLLGMNLYLGTRIISVREFLVMHRQLP